MTRSTEDAPAKLAKLIDHGRKTAWSPAHDIDWERGSEALDRLHDSEREALRSILSLVYYSDAQGKQILTALCRALDRNPRVEIPLAEKAHEFFVQQMDDEHRHTVGLELLFKRLRIEPEQRAASHVFYSKILCAEGMFDAKLILIYWYIEVLAKGIFVELKKRFPDTCVDSLFTRVIRDEARHVGFGEVFIPAYAANAGLGRASVAQMSVAHYSSVGVLPVLYRLGHYARAARVLGLNTRGMFTEGINEILVKARRLPEGRRFIDLSTPAQWFSSLF